MRPYLGKPTGQRENQLLCTLRNARSSTKTQMEIEKMKSVLLVDRASNWLQIWTAASSLDVKGNKAIKTNLFFSLTGWFSQINAVTYDIVFCWDNLSAQEALSF